jgi:hypothetical protein
MNPYWSYFLSAVGILGIYLAGKKNKAGWAVGFGVQGVWIAYAIASRQWGFILSAIAYGTVYARNWIKWRADERSAEADQ